MTEKQQHTQAPEIIDVTSGVNKGVLYKSFGREQVTGLLATHVPHGSAHHVSAMPGIYLREHRRADHMLGYKRAAFPSGRSYSNLAKKLLPLHLSAIFLSSADEVWTKAVRDAIDHILLVEKNNPGKSITEIMFRPDVQDALETAGRDGAQAVITELLKVWNSPNGVPSDSKYLDKVISDMERNAKSFAARMTIAIHQGDRSDIEKTILKDRLRALAAESVVETRAKNEASLDAFKRAGITHIKWKARTYPGTDIFETSVCSTCQELHNTVVKLGSPFPSYILASHGLKIYGDLVVPPAHPNCKCRIVPA